MLLGYAAGARLSIHVHPFVFQDTAVLARVERRDDGGYNRGSQTVRSDPSSHSRPSALRSASVCTYAIPQGVF